MQYSIFDMSMTVMREAKLTRSLREREKLKSVQNTEKLWRIVKSVHLIVKLFCLSIVSMNASKNHLLLRRPSNCNGMMLDNLPFSVAPHDPTHLQHCVVQLCPRLIHPMDPWIQEEWVVTDAREEHFHHKGPVVEEGNARGLEVHREVGHVRL